MAAPADHNLSGGGPRTPQGKARSRLNAVRHGATATTAVASIAGEDAYARKVSEFRAELAPRSPIEEHRVRQISQAALACEIAGANYRAVMRYLAAELDERHGPRTDLDRKLSVIAESSAFQSAARYDHAADARFARLLLQYYIAREANGRGEPHASNSPAPPPLTAPPPVDAQCLAALRTAFADEPSAMALLTTLRARYDSERPDLDPECDEARAMAWEAVCALPFFREVSVESLTLLRFLAEWLADPASPVKALQTRSGIGRRETCIRLCRLLRRDGQPKLRWVGRALSDFLRPP